MTTGQRYLLECILLFLSFGTVWGCLFLLGKVIKIVFGVGKIGEAIGDILLCAAGAVGVFLCALAYDSGRLRFFQLLLHCIGAAAVIWAFDPFVKRVAGWVYRQLKKGKNLIKKTARAVRLSLRKKITNKKKKKKILSVKARNKSKNKQKKRNTVGKTQKST